MKAKIFENLTEKADEYLEALALKTYYKLIQTYDFCEPVTDNSTTDSFITQDNTLFFQEFNWRHDQEPSYLYQGEID